MEFRKTYRTVCRETEGTLKREKAEESSKSHDSRYLQLLSDVDLSNVRFGAFGLLYYMNAYPQHLEFPFFQCVPLAFFSQWHPQTPILTPKPVA